MVKKRKHSKQKKIIISLSIFLILFLSIGYAAFGTNISLKTKGNIKTEYITFGNVTVSISKKNDGLFRDEYESGRYIYKGTNPNNYITFNNEEYRIVAIEKDKTIKIIKNTAITDKINYDNTSRSDYNTGYYTTRYNKDGYCTNTSGCNWWASSKSTYDITYALTETVTLDNTNLALPEEDSLANQYLNGTDIFQNKGYYDSLDENSKKQIESHYFNIGPTTTNNNDIQTTINEEEKYKWKGNVGLLNASDYMKSHLNAHTYMESIYEWYWFINPLSNTRNKTTSANHTGGMVYWGIGSKVGIVPVIYLNKNINLLGTGEKTNPYQIIKKDIN